MQKITTFLSFKDKGFEAINFYLSIFKKSKLNYISRDGDKLLYAAFELDGSQFMAMDGGEPFKFEMGTSMYIDCADQKEVDYYWEKLTADGGEPGQCGWLKDKYGVSWQVVPKVLGELLMGKEPAQQKKVMDAMLKMGKLDIDGLKKAAQG